MAIYALKMQDLVEKNDQNLSYFYWSLHCIALHWSCLIFLYWWMLWHHNLIGFASQYHLHFYFLKTWYFTVKALKYSQNLVLPVLYLRPSLENLQIFQTLRQIYGTFRPCSFTHLTFLEEYWHMPGQRRRGRVRGGGSPGVITAVAYTCPGCIIWKMLAQTRTGKFI